MSGRRFEFYVGAIRRIRIPIAMAAYILAILGMGFLMFGRMEWLPIFGGILAAVAGGLAAAAMAQVVRMIRAHRTVFFSYTHQDAEFVMKLAKDLERMNLEPLIDRLELKVGDNIGKAVDGMIDRSDYFVFVVSESSMKSDWAKKELEQAMSRKKKVLPVVLHATSVPPELAGVFYADFSENYETGMEQLQKTFGVS